MSEVRQIQLGKLKLKSNIFYAPLAGCSDFPFRKMSARFSPGLMYCEMVKMDALIRYDHGTFRMLDYSPDMRPIGAQICGSRPSLVKAAASIIEDLGFDVIDLNCGCPVDKVTKDGSGSGLLKDPRRIGDIISNMVASVSIPVTVKIRAGWCENSLVFEELVRIAEAAGAKAICLHGRTREQGYAGSANWQWIKKAKQASNNIVVIGNGDLFSAEAACNMFGQTGCDAVLVSRGTLGAPWICQEIEALANNKAFDTSVFQKRALTEHFEEILRYAADRRTVIDMRRIGSWYIKKQEHTRAFRQAMSKCQTVEEIRELITDLAGC